MVALKTPNFYLTVRRYCHALDANACYPTTTHSNLLRLKELEGKESAIYNIVDGKSFAGRQLLEAPCSRIFFPNLDK